MILPLEHDLMNTGQFGRLFSPIFLSKIAFFKILSNLKISSIPVEQYIESVKIAFEMV